jgi:hypothetical protein
VICRGIRTVLAALAFVLLAAAGCGGEADRVEAAGDGRVAVIESSGGDLPEWSIMGEPLVDIGSVGGDPLVNVSRAARVGETLVVADAGARRLGFYGRDGSLLRAAGGRGHGPGEFQHPAWAGALGEDSVLVWDAGVRRFSVFSAQGEWARSFAPQGLTGSFPAVHGVFGDGSVLMTSGMQTGGSGSAPRRDTLTFLRVGRDGAVLGEPGRFPGPEYYEVEGGPAGRRSYARPFGRETFAVVQPDGFWVTTGDSYELVEHGMDGTPRRIVRRRVPPVRLTRRDADAYRRELLSAVGAADEPAWRHALDAASFPDALPPLAGLAPGPSGEVWVREAQPPSTFDDGARWTVFAADGAPRGRATVPPRFTLWQAGEDWILGGTTAGDGSERVRMYRVVRR